ncbi:tyrosine-type recombinase/integrase [Roseibium aggregatum]|uniref:tyrosine-type recombinase/integrase n=1 Tax=Roseibium aggregatum TaxID=187304 RepID=UPI001A8FEB57|nr:site-specific integrase [Roseibium aggregatum]MBN8182010.1 site-specific integrase [Roseibium aggregatum]
MAITKRTGKSGTTYRAEVMIDRKRYSETFARRAQAQAWIVKMKEEAAAGFLDRGKPLKGLKLAEAHTMFVEDAERTGVKIGASTLSALNQWTPGRVYVASVDKAFILDYAINAKGRGLAPSTVAGHLIALRSLLINLKDYRQFDVARQLDGLNEGYRVASKRGLVGSSTKRDRRVSDDVLMTLKAVFAGQERKTDLSALMPAIIDIALAGGFRLAEIARLRWDDLDRKGRKILVRQRKHPDPRVKATRDEWVPLLRGTGIDAMAVILSQPRRPGEDRIFPVTPASVTGAFSRAVTAAGVGDVWFHDLRHECLSRLAALGHDVLQLQKVSGHRDLNSLKRYVSLRAEDVARKDAELVADRQQRDEVRPQLAVVNR